MEMQKRNFGATVRPKSENHDREFDLPLATRFDQW
jgi:hypothetical protein